MRVEIKQVTTKRERKQFVLFPFTLFKDSPYWVPPLIADELKTFDSKRNPAFDYCEACFWLAYKDGKIAGRIAGIINHRANEHWGEKKVRFGWVDFIDDAEVVDALFRTVENWGKEKGMEAVHGPMGFTDFDYEGMVVEGFDKLPTIANIYNYPYYPQHLERLGYGKVEDWLQKQFNASQPIPEKFERVNAQILKRYGITAKRFTRRKDLLPYASGMFKALNQSFADLYGFVALTPKEIEYYIDAYFSFIRPELVSFLIDENNEVVGFGISIPSLSRAFQKARGRLFPFGFIHILRALRKYDTIDLYLNGVLPKWQGKGVVASIYVELNKAYIEQGVKTAVSNQQLEENTNAISIWDNYEHEPYIRRRCYLKKL